MTKPLTLEQFRQYLAERPAPKPKKPKDEFAFRGNKPTTPEQITRLYRERKRNALPEHLRPKQRPRLDLSPEEQRRRLYKTVNRPKAVPDHSTEYWRLYDLARHNPQLSKDKPNYVPRTTPYVRKPRYGKRLGRRIKETRWSGTAATLRPHIARQIRQAHGLISRKPPAIPRGTLTQTQLHAVLDYVPHLGEFWWIAGQHTGSEAGYVQHQTFTRPHKGAKNPAHASKRFPDPHLGLRPQRATSPHPPRSYPGGRILTGRTREQHPVDRHNNPICKPCITLPIHTDTRGPDGLIHRHEDHHLVRPYNPLRVITVGGVTYPAWQLAILWMGAGYVFDFQYNSIPVPSRVGQRQLSDEGCEVFVPSPDNNTLLTATRLPQRASDLSKMLCNDPNDRSKATYNSPAAPVFRDGNTLNLCWDNIRPDTAPIYPSHDDLLKAQRKFNALYKRKLQKERQFQAMTAQEKRNHLSNQARKERINKERAQHRAIHKYDLDKCIISQPFNRVQNKWVVQIPCKPKSTFFSYDDALAHYTETMCKINSSQPKPAKQNN